MNFKDWLCRLMRGRNEESVTQESPTVNLLQEYKDERDEFKAWRRQTEVRVQRLEAAVEVIQHRSDLEERE